MSNLYYYSKFFFIIILLFFIPIIIYYYFYYLYKNPEVVVCVCVSAIEIDWNIIECKKERKTTTNHRSNFFLVIPLLTLTLTNKIKMASPLSEGIIEYSDGTEATMDQMAKDVTTFLAWAAEPELEERHRVGFKVIIYLLLLTILVYLSMKKIWSRIDPEV